MGVSAACLVVVCALWKSFVITSPEHREKAEPSLGWTDRLGLAISIAWPFQCGFLLVVLDSESLPAIAAGQ